MTRNEMIVGRLSVRDIETIPSNPRPQPDVKEENPLLSLIFAPDERGCLNGDLSQYHERTNVRQSFHFLS